MSHEDVLIRRTGQALHITLNRPRALNALTVETCRAIHTAVAAETEAKVIIIDGAGERGLCGGGDIKRMVEAPEKAREFLHAEYLMDDAVHRAAIPVVSFLSGITMGGGIGLAGHATHRIVSEHSRLAMPETRIGIMPDVGGHLLLARAPGFLGEYLAVTSGSFGAADALYTGFADAFVPEAEHDALKAELIAGADPRVAVAARHTQPAAAVLPKIQEWWDPVIAELDAEGAAALEPVARAQQLFDTLRDEPQAADFLADAAQMCPTSVVVTLEQVRRTRLAELTLREVLEDDFRITSQLVARPDFAEGVRARVIDKDNSPNWNPATLEEVSESEIARLLGASEPRPKAVLFSEDSPF